MVDGQAAMLVLWDGQAALMLVLAGGGRGLDANVALLEDLEAVKIAATPLVGKYFAQFSDWVHSFLLFLEV